MSNSYYENGAKHYDHHKEIHIDTVNGGDIGKLISAFFKDDAEEAAYEEVVEDGEGMSANEKALTLDADSIAKCFKFNSEFVKRNVSKVVADCYLGNYANLALIEITLFHHQQLKKRNSHKAFVMSLAEWGIITIADDKELKKIVMGVGDKYKRLPKEGYKEWDDKFKEDRLACERIGEKLDSTMAYQL